MDFIRKVSNKVIYKYISPIQFGHASLTPGFVELWDLSISNTNWNSIKETIANIATLSYGNEKAKNPDKLFQLLEDLGHESVLEFIRFPRIRKHEYYQNIEDIWGFSIEKSLRNMDDWKTYEDMLDGTEEENRINMDEFIEAHKTTLAVFKIKVPLFTRSQYHRHRLTYLEMSRRYVKPDKVRFEFWYPENLVNYSEYAGNIHNCVLEYHKMIEIGIPPEEARSILPQSLYTTFWVMKDYIQAKNFYIERYSNKAQKQIREVAKAELELLKEYQPEFLGQYVYVAGDEKKMYTPLDENRYVHILDIFDRFKHLMDENIDILYIEYGNSKYYAKFSLMNNMFTGKIKKQNVVG